MKRSFAIYLVIGAALGLAACEASPEKSLDADVAPDGWIAAPQVEQVVRRGDAILVSGTGAPFGRVVLTGADGVVYAAGADARGHFDVRIPAPRQDALMAVEVQVGQIAYPAARRLLVAADPRGPVALLGIGAPTRRLDGAGTLDAVDTDGRATFLSGRAQPDTDVVVVRNGDGSVRTDRDGRWTLLVSGDVRDPVQIAGRMYVPPAPASGQEDVLERAGEGWRMRWSQDSGHQTTWFPDA